METGKQTFTDSPCNLCPRNCMAKRAEGEKGYCAMGRVARVARASLHMWEEPCISGKNGSGTVFFSGCNLGCVYCQNYEISAEGKGIPLSVSRMKELFLQLQEKRAANLNLVTPDHFILPVAEAVKEARKAGLVIPVVYNCSGYEKVEVITYLRGIVDIFLTDFKYMDAELAERLSGARDYPRVAEKALQAMVEVAGEPCFDEDGMMQKGVIVRHLLLPGHKRNAREVIRYVYETYRDKVYISLLNQYTPYGRAKENGSYPELARRVTKREYESVVSYLLEMGVKNAYIQEGKTAEESFIPSFNGEGIL